MTTTDWVKTEIRLPEENVVVDTLSEGGINQRLMRVGNLWFLSDGSMYVYYIPIFWRPLW